MQNLFEVRYAGTPADFLRGFRALYFGVLMNCMVIGWVNLAMEKILGTTILVSRHGALMAFTGFYTSISGLWGVLWTDMVQFVLKMGMVVLLAYFGVETVGRAARDEGQTCGGRCVADGVSRRFGVDPFFHPQPPFESVFLGGERVYALN